MSGKIGIYSICFVVTLVLLILLLQYPDGVSYDSKDIEYYKVSSNFSTLLEHGVVRKWNSGDFLGRFSIYSHEDYLYGFEINQKCKILGIDFEKPVAYHVYISHAGEEYFDINNNTVVKVPDEEYYLIYNIDDLPYNDGAIYSWDMFEGDFGFFSDVFGVLTKIYNGAIKGLTGVFRPFVDFFTSKG